MYNICVVDYIIDGLYVDDQKPIDFDDTPPRTASQDYPFSVFDD